MNILILGSTGLIGSSLYFHLSCNHNVFGTFNNKEKIKKIKKIKFIKKKITECEK